VTGVNGHGFAEADGAFSIPGLMPGRHKIDASIPGWLCRAEVDVPSGGVGEVVLVPQRVALLRLRSTELVPKCVLEFFVAEGSGPWEIRGRFGGDDGKPLSHDLTVRPGRVRWRVRFDADNIGRVAAETAEGEVQVVAGDQPEIRVPIVQRQDNASAHLR
jgi:hypothetical protein